MSAEIKPGMLCFIAAVPFVNPRFIGRCVTAVTINSCPCRECDALRAAFGPLWDSAGEWLAVEHPGIKAFCMPQSWLIPITPPDEADLTDTPVDTPVEAS